MATVKFILLYLSIFLYVITDNEIISEAYRLGDRLLIIFTDTVSSGGKLLSINEIIVNPLIRKSKYNRLIYFAVCFALYSIL